MPRYRSSPGERHKERVCQIYGYLCKFRHFKLRFLVVEPYYFYVPAIPNHNWEHSVYGKHVEEFAENPPELLSKKIVLTQSFDTSLICDILS